MKPGHEVLRLLRAQPAAAIRGWGFITRGAPLGLEVGGPCTVACAQYRQTSIYELSVTADGPDWFIPYRDGHARHCEVPLGQPDGTMVVTFPMNGCALEVHATKTGNRFFHDADGRYMDRTAWPRPKFRAEYADYAGPDNTTHERTERYIGPDHDNTGGYEHNILCIKSNGRWHVYASAVIRVNQQAWQVKDRVPYELGSFPDWTPA